MYLVMTKYKARMTLRLDICKLLNASLANGSYDGESTQMIQSHLNEEQNDRVVVTADSRLLMFVGEIFSLEHVFVYDHGNLTSLSSLTRRELKSAHNLMRLYEAGEFDKS